MDTLKSVDISPKYILEIGASNGERLEMLPNKYKNTKCTGIEPSEKAIEDCNKKFHDIRMIQGVAVNLPFNDNAFDFVVIGFCLYLCDREDLFRIASEIDRVLSDHGHLISMIFTTLFLIKTHIHTLKVSIVIKWTTHLCSYGVRTIG